MNKTILFIQLILIILVIPLGLLSQPMIEGRSENKIGVFGASERDFGVVGMSTSNHGAYFSGNNTAGFGDILLSGPYADIVTSGNLIRLRSQNTQGVELSFDNFIGTKINLFDDGAGIYGFGIAPAELQIGTYDNSKHISFGHYSGASKTFVEWMQINSSSLKLSSGAYVSEGGVWTNACSRNLKENIKELDTHEAIITIMELNPVRYNYKSQKDEEYLGFIAEDVPALLATQDRQSLSTMDIISALTKVVQDQQKQLEEIKNKLSEMKLLLANEKR